MKNNYFEFICFFVRILKKGKFNKKHPDYEMGEMMSQGKTLSGIERELVLQYLIDGNVPVTISTIRSNEAIEKQDFELVPMNSAVFPVALKAENVSVLKEGIILLKNPPKSVSNFIGQKVRVEFYFNRVGLFFVTQLKAVKAKPITLPDGTKGYLMFANTKQAYDLKKDPKWIEANHNHKDASAIIDGCIGKYMGIYVIEYDFAPVLETNSFCFETLEIMSLSV